MSLKIAVAQLNFIVGDMPGNAQKIIEAAKTAYEQGARLLLTPELSICAYICEGRKPAFVDDVIGLVIGPLFVVAELVFALGLRRDLHAAITERAGPVRRGPRPQGAH